MPSPRNSAKTKRPVATTEKIRVRRVTENRRKYFCTPKGRAYQIFNNARQRAKKRDIEFTINLAWVQDRVEAGFCQVTGLDLEIKNIKQYGKEMNAQPFGPTLDRKNPSLGYTEDNTQVVVAVYNYAKMHWSHEDVVIMASALLRKENNNEV